MKMKMEMEMKMKMHMQIIENHGERAQTRLG